MEPALSDINCLKLAAIRCRLDRIWYRWLRLLGKIGIPCKTKGADFLWTIQSGYSSSGLLQLPPMVVEYFEKFVTRRGFKIADADPEGNNGIRVEGTRCILAQFKNGPPGIAKDGFIQVAFSEYAERFMLDVRTGEVVVCRSPMISHELYEWDKAGRIEDVGLVAVRSGADYTFKDLAMMFWCFENFPEDEDREDEPD
jgi:hypothetical protein